jgi:hypothetical protein
MGDGAAWESLGSLHGKLIREKNHREHTSLLVIGYMLTHYPTIVDIKKIGKDIGLSEDQILKLSGEAKKYYEEKTKRP